MNCPHEVSFSLGGRYSAQRGFALIAVITILALLLVLILAISSVVHVETRMRASGKNLLLARQNALLGLDTAVAQLQEYAGKDQAVTFPATTFYPTKDVNLPTSGALRAGRGKLFDDASFGLRHFANEANARSYLNKATTYLVPSERESWNNALAAWWNAGRSPRWIGVMDAALRVDAASNPSAKPSAISAQRYESNPQTLFGEPKRDQLPVWLVSGNERFTINQENNTVLDASGAVVATSAYPEGYQTPDTVLPTPQADKTVVELVGYGSATDSDKSSDGLDGRVRVRKQDIRTMDAMGADQVTGHYAYWVGDESTKANFALRDATSTNDSSYPNDVGKSSEVYRNRLQSPQRIGWQNITGFSDATFGINDARLENISTSSEIALLEDANTAAIQEAGKESFHSLTAFSRSLLTDTALGGLKADLTGFLKKGSGLSSADPIADRRRYDPQDSRFRAWNGVNSGFPTSGSAAALDGIPSWGQVREWYQADSSGGGTIAPGKANGVFPVPVQVAFQGAWSYRNKKVRLHWMPMVVLWNPYDVSLAAATYTLQISFSPTTSEVYLCKPDPTLAELQAADPEAGWTGIAGDKSSWKFTATDGSQQSIVLTAPDSTDTTSGPWPKGALDGGLTDMFGRLFYELKSADSGAIYANYSSSGANDRKSSIGPKNYSLRFSPHENNNTPRDSLPSARRQFYFRITAAFGPGEARVFTVGQTQEWKKDGTAIDLVNDINLTEMPAQVWFDVLDVVNGPASAGAAGLKFFPGPGLDQGVAIPSVSLSLGGDELFHVRRFGDLGASKAWAGARGASYSTKNGETGNDAKPLPKFISYWRDIHDFGSSEFDNHFDPLASNETAATNWGHGVTWFQPFTQSPNGGEGGPWGANIQDYTAAFSRFNFAAAYMDLHPNIDVYRSKDYVSNSDSFTKLSQVLYDYTPKWDDDQASGEFANVLITRRSDAAKIPFQGLTKLSVRNARRAQSEILSLGQLQQINLSPYYWQPAFPIGNSFAAPYTDREAIAGIHSRAVGRSTSNGGVMGSVPNAGNRGEISGSYTRNVETPGNLTMDLSYLLNENLWDRFFLSTIEGTPSPASALANSRLRFTEDALTASSSEITDFETASAYLQNVGALNVNSTSEEAWKALLTAFRRLDLGGNPSDTVPIARTLDPISGSIKFHFDTGALGARGGYGNTATNKDYSKVFSGFRYLDDQMIETLAKRIVDEVRQRGPFLSLADFVNRRLVAPEGAGKATSAWSIARTQGVSTSHPGFIDPDYDPFPGLQGLSGTLERAIQLSGINGGLNHPGLGNNGAGVGEANDMVYNVRIRNLGNTALVSSGASEWTSAGIGKGANVSRGHGLGTSYAGFLHSQEPAMRSYLDSEHLAGAAAGEAGQLLDGTPAFVTQGDLLAMIGPALTARGDTFLVRAYGDVLDKSQRVISRACLEAVVQREADPVAPAASSGSDKWRPTDRFGRKFKVIKLRWLNPEDV